ncbi:unnamed protein product [marine sediment metagenome]|uniref:Uncharacterized protein n=1 Tax=marine sediment metagenome TaxID=412755 RepID=X1CJ68_9ZZZZ
MDAHARSMMSPKKDIGLKLFFEDLGGRFIGKKGTLRGIVRLNEIDG